MGVFDMQTMYEFSDYSLIPTMDIGDKIKGLIDLYTMGIKIPYGFIIPTRIYREYKNECCLPQYFLNEINIRIKSVEKHFGQIFGDLNSKNPPLLFSIRCGDKSSEEIVLPETLVNIGIKKTNSSGFLKNLYFDFQYQLIDFLGK